MSKSLGYSLLTLGGLVWAIVLLCLKSDGSISTTELLIGCGVGIVILGILGPILKPLPPAND